MSKQTLDLSGLGIDSSKLNLEIDFSQYEGMLDNPDTYQRATNTTRVRVGEETRYQVNLNGQTYNGWLKVHSARLTNLSLIWQENAVNSYWIVTGLMNPVKLDLEFEIDNRRISMVDFLFEHAKKTNPNADYSNFSREKWIDFLARMGMYLTEGQPMFFQQMGARDGSYQEAIETLGQHFNLVRNFDSIAPDKRGRIRDAYKIVGGAEVTEFEIGSTDPTKTDLYRVMNIAQGFTDLGNAVYENFKRIAELRKSAKIKTLIRDENLSKLSEAEIRSINAAIQSDTQMSSQYANSWGGAARVFKRDVTGDYEKMNRYAASEVPCGRFTLLNANGEPLAFNFWKDSRIADTSNTTETAVTAATIKDVAGFNE